MTLTQLIIAALATWQIVEIWHHSALMASLRARVDAMGNVWAELPGCPYCLSVWVGAVVAPALALSEPRRWWCWLSYLIVGLAVSRLANLANDLGHDWCRTPRENRLDESVFAQIQSEPAAGHDTV